MMEKIILFDFDGVIVDSFKACLEASQVIHPALTEDIYRRRFEGNINETSLESEGHDERCRHEIDFWSELLPRVARAAVFPGMIEVVDELRKKYRLVVVSSTVSAPIRQYLESHAIADHFDDILGNDVHKSKVEKIKMVLQKYSADPHNCVFITDTLGDMHEAGEAGVGTIGVSWGFQRHKTLERGESFQIVDAPPDLLGAVEAYFA